MATCRFSVAAEAAKWNFYEPRNWFPAGKGAEEQANYDVSIRWLTRAVELDRSYPDPHYRLSIENFQSLFDVLRDNMESRTPRGSACDLSMFHP